MGIEDLGLLLENIEEYVMERKMIVTYKWLSKTFSINVNQAKQLLAIFHMKHKNMKHKSIQGVYYVSGMRLNSSGDLIHQICLVNEDMLEDAKSQLQPLTSVHLFSIQKGKPKDTTTIYDVDLEQLKKKVFETTEFSMIKCPEARISQAISTRPVTPPTLKNKVKVIGAPSAVPKPTVKETKPTVKRVPKKSVGKASLANFFGKSGDGKSNNIKKVSPVKETKIKPSPPKVKPSPPKVKPSPPKVKPSPPKVKPSPPKVKPSPPKVNIAGNRRPTRSARPLQVSDDVLERDVTQKKSIKNESGKTGKRKRIQKFSSSEDEEIDQKLKEAKISDSDDRCGKRVKRKRVKKLVSSTSINEDGFMETEKVWKDVSCTDESGDEGVGEGAAKEDVKTEPLVPKQKNKQSSLMGYFKKT